MKIGEVYRKSMCKLIKDNLEDISGLFIINYSGIKAADLNGLRQSLKKANGRMFVAKNTIIKQAFSETDYKDLANLINGPCSLIFIKDDPAQTARLLYDFRKDHEGMKFAGGSLQDRLLDEKGIEALAKLPTRHVLRAQTVAAIKSVLYAIVFVLNENLRKLVYGLEQIRKRKSEGG